MNPFEFCKPFNSTEHVREGWLHYACWATEISQFWGYEAKQCNTTEQLNDDYKIENITFQDRFFSHAKLASIPTDDFYNRTNNESRKFHVNILDLLWPSMQEIVQNWSAIIYLNSAIGMNFFVSHDITWRFGQSWRRS